MTDQEIQHKEELRQLEQLQQMQQSNTTSASQQSNYEVGGLVRLRTHPKSKHVPGKPNLRQFQILVHWKGYNDDTWEPFENLIEDVPDMVDGFFKRRYGVLFSKSEI